MSCLHTIWLNDQETAFWDLDNHHIPGDVTDPDVVEAFNQKYATFVVETDPSEILLRVANNRGSNQRDVEGLASLTVDDYFNLFTKSRGRDLSRMISAALQFGRFQDASPEMQAISDLAREALTKTGQQSAMNARRARKFGVHVDQDPGVLHLHCQRSPNVILPPPNLPYNHSTSSVEGRFREAR